MRRPRSGSSQAASEFASALSHHDCRSSSCPVLCRRNKTAAEDDMSFNRLLRWIGAMLIACAPLMLPTAARADYPDKPIRLIVPQAPGSATDTVARILAAELGPAARPDRHRREPPRRRADHRHRSWSPSRAPDGYTLGMGPIGALAITRHMVAKLPYDIERDFQPIALVDARAPAARGVAEIGLSTRSRT